MQICPYLMPSKARISVWGKIELKRDHAYYAQIQGQMAVCELKTSYFVIWTTQECHTQKVQFSEEYRAQIRPKLDLFYRQHILTGICTHKLKKQFLIAEASCLCKRMSKTCHTVLCLSQGISSEMCRLKKASW